MAQTLAELDNITGDDLMAHWQFIKAVLEFKFGDLSKEDALEHMSYYSGLEVFFCEIMLKEMCREKLGTLMISFPDLEPCPPPYYPLPVPARGTSRGSSRRAVEPSTDPHAPQ
jgi:hypothetical protein